MNKSIRVLAAVIAAGMLFLSGAFSVAGNLSVVSSAYAQNWKDEFDDVCSKTQDAMLLTDDELQGLIDRCDKLKPLIEKLDGAQARVYLKRLAMCRDLYEYVLRSRQKK